MGKMGLATAVHRSRINHSVTDAPSLLSERRTEPAVDNRIKEDHIMVGGVNTYYLEKGPVDGPVIVLLQPSGNADPWAWEKVMKEMPDTYRLLAPGFKGFGRTELPEDDKCTIEGLSESVKDFLSAKGIDGPIGMMGASAGAFVAMMFAKMNPGRVERLALIDSYAPAVLADYPKFVSWALSHPTFSMKALGIGLNHKKIFEVSLKVYEQINGTSLHKEAQANADISAPPVQSEKSTEAKHSNTLKVYFNGFRDLHNPEDKISPELIDGTIDYLRKLPPAFFQLISDHRRHAKIYESMIAEIKENVPVIVVMHGNGDMIINEGASAKLAQLFGVELRKIDGSGHAPQRENTSKFMQIIREDFLPKEEVHVEEAKEHHHRNPISWIFRREKRHHTELKVA